MITMNGLLRREHHDADEETDREIQRDSKTRFSQVQILKRNIRWTIIGDRPPSRKEVFSKIQTTSDLKIWNVEVGQTTIRCAKVYNPLLLEKTSGHWDTIVGVERLDVEDPEGTLLVIPKHVMVEMKHLESLTITWSKIRSLPSTLFKMPLRYLHLRQNQLRSVVGIGRAEHLMELDLSSNRIEVLPKEFGRLINLKTLNLSGNELRELPDDIGSLFRLKSVECSSNKLRSLPNSICNMVELTVLDVCSNQLTSFPENIGNLPCLADLRARGNQLQSLPGSFGQLVRLNSLILSKNRFDEVPFALSRLQCLEYLNMTENAITTMELSISSLRTLVLDINNLTEIGNGILTSLSLQQLSLQKNRIARVPEEIRNLRNLRSLLLSGNEIDNLPSSVRELQELRHLGVGSTPISGLPEELVYLKNLTNIDLECCPNLPSNLRDKGLTGIIEVLAEQLPVEKKEGTFHGNPLRNIAGQSLYPDQTRKDTPRNKSPKPREATHVSKSRRFTAGKTIFPDQLPAMRRLDEMELKNIRPPEEEVEYAEVHRRDVRRMAGQTLDVPVPIQFQSVDPPPSHWPRGHSDDPRLVRYIGAQSQYPSDDG